MPELSNLLRQRLGGPGTGADPSLMHPDADTLNAYVEQLLPSAERRSVVTHLSVCALCREVVALSLPQLTEPMIQGQAVIPTSRWRRWWTPGFRWAGGLAAVAIAAALIVELPRRIQVAQPDVSRSEVVQPEVARDAQQTNVAPVAEQPAKPEQVSSDKLAETANGATGYATSALRADTRLQQPGLKDTPKAAAFLAKKEIAGKQLAGEASKSPVLIAGAAGAVKQDYYVNNGMLAFNYSDATSYKYDNLPQAPTPQPGIDLGLAYASPAHIGDFSGIPTNANKKTKFMKKFIPLYPVDLDCLWCKVAGIRHLAKTTPASPAITPHTVVFSAMEAPLQLGSSLRKNQSTQFATAPEKLASGELDRSEAFTRRAATAPAGTRSKEGAAGQMHWKVADGKLFKSVDLDQWQDAYSRADANFEFSFVAAHGADVWAGGSHAALVHSRDGGTMWETVRVGDSASGTIVSIVANGLNIQVKTSDNQSWSSSDAGKTWAPQSGQD